MADFVRPEDWGLQAIVRGNSTTEFWNTTHDPSSCFGAGNFMEMVPKDHSVLFDFSGVLDTASVLTDELQDLYKPFYSVSSYSSPSQSSPAAPTTPPSSKEVKQEPQPEDQVAQMDNSSTVAAAAYVPKYKRRKNQQSRVVLQVTAEDLSSDKWAWRKYGQKPIKGSPYPRSYYRCSSSKGCLARKQVEQSCTDPGIFIITYTAEHSHSQPTRRNALAGTIRHKFSSGPKSPTSSNTSSSKAARSGDSGRCNTSPTPYFSDLSPGNPLLVAEEESIGTQMVTYKNEGRDDHMQTGALCPEVMQLDDDFFSCFDDLDGFISGLRDGGHCYTGTTASSESDYL